MSEKDYEAEEKERTKARNLDRLEGDDAMMTWMLFAGAALAGGESAMVAGKKADAMIAEAKRRFT